MAVIKLQRLILLLNAIVVEENIKECKELLYIRDLVKKEIKIKKMIEFEISDRL